MSAGRIAIIGTGNVATHLIEWFEAADFQVTSVYTRSPEANQHLTIPLRTNLNYRDEVCSFILIATKDDAVAEVADQLSNTGDAIVLHTSGSVPLEAIDKKNFAGTGVLYPLQTLQKDREVALNEVPFLLEGRNQGDLRRIEDLCKTVGIHYSTASSEERMYYHVSAVMSANFTNHLLFLAEKFLASHSLNVEVLRPLLMETVKKAFEQGAFNSQTGPAKRGDQKTIDRHKELLDDVHAKGLYEAFSQSILSTYRQ